MPGTARTHPLTPWSISLSLSLEHTLASHPIPLVAQLEVIRSLPGTDRAASPIPHPPFRPPERTIRERERKRESARARERERARESERDIV